MVKFQSSDLIYMFKKRGLLLQSAKIHLSIVTPKNEKEHQAEI